MTPKKRHTFTILDIPQTSTPTSVKPSSMGNLLSPPLLSSSTVYLNRLQSMEEDSQTVKQVSIPIFVIPHYLSFELGSGHQNVGSSHSGVCVVLDTYIHHQHSQSFRPNRRNERRNTAPMCHQYVLATIVSFASIIYNLFSSFFCLSSCVLDAIPELGDKSIHLWFHVQKLSKAHQTSFLRCDGLLSLAVHTHFWSQLLLSPTSY